MEMLSSGLISLFPTILKPEKNKAGTIFLTPCTYDPSGSMHNIPLKYHEILRQRCKIHGEAVPDANCTCGVKTTLNFERLYNIMTLPQEKRILSDGLLTLAIFKLRGKIIVDSEWNIRSWGAAGWFFLVDDAIYNIIQQEYSKYPTKYASDSIGPYYSWNFRSWWNYFIYDGVGNFSRWPDVVPGNYRSDKILESLNMRNNKK